MSETRPEGSDRYRAVDPPGNSRKSKEEPSAEKPAGPEVKQIATARTRKKGVGSKIKESFMGEDAGTVGQFVLFDVVLPTIQQLFVDAFQQGIERMVLGDSRPNRARRAQERRAPTNYSGYSSNRAPVRERRPESGFSERARETHDFDEIVLPDRGAAEEVLDMLGDTLEQYEQVSISVLLRLVGIRPSYMDDRWGWTDLRSAEVRRVRDGYTLQLPRPVDLSRL